MLTKLSNDSVKSGLRTYTSRTPPDVQKILQAWEVLVIKVIYSVKQNMSNPGWHSYPKFCISKSKSKRCNVYRHSQTGKI